MKNNKTAILFVVAAIGLVIMPLVLQTFGNSWVRILDTALLYVLLAVGLNIVGVTPVCWTWATLHFLRWAPICSVC